MIEIKNLSKVFQTSDGKVDALKNISLTIEDGDIYGIIGMSGAGKSTLVRCINMLERPTEGSVLIDKKNIGELSPKELRSIRREITMIFQGFNLLMQKTCLKNIMFPLKLAGVRTEEAKKKPLNFWKLSVFPTKPMPIPHSFPAVSSSVLPLPVLWQRSPRCCSATRPPAHLTPRPLTPS